LRGYWLRPCVHLCLFVTSRCFIRTDGPIEVHRRGTACSTYAANRSCCQHRLSTVDLVDDTYDGRRVLAVYCASVNCNPLTSLLRLVVLQPVHVFVRQLTTFRPTRRVARSVCSPSAVAQILVGTRCTQSRVCAFFVPGVSGSTLPVTPFLGSSPLTPPTVVTSSFPYPARLPPFRQYQEENASDPFSCSSAAAADDNDANRY